VSAFSQLKQSDGTLVDFEPKVAPPPKRPRRWALSNWPVRWKVFAIVLVPLVLAGALGGLRIYSSVTETTDLRRAADRAEMVPAIVDDVSKGVTSMIDDGQALMDKVTSNSINLFERVTTYAPILLTAEDAINGSVRVDDEHITAETLG